MIAQQKVLATHNCWLELNQSLR